MADPLAVLVLLGAVAAAASLSANQRADAPAGAAGEPAEAGGAPGRADDVVKAWLDSLTAIPAPKR